MDDKIIGLYASGLTVRNIHAPLEDVYGLKVSADLIGRVADAVLDEVREWQSRALTPSIMTPGFLARLAGVVWMRSVNPSASVRAKLL